MASSELSGRGRTLQLRPVATVDANATVRHVDQFDEETLSALWSAIETDRSLPAAGTGLEPGDVVVFTDYYRVDRV
ncbi:hypothetical protein ACFO5R_13745 [Halosolutus amylolyticus]|uniref:Uncharacterized protein n=1 Tax=Halosolutus amylolyticus TaxID=2932267 RepID=A0ABD5PSQ7_9EURY|nr:hypothetical protein [Halosolutus amylolyticus]